MIAGSVPASAAPSSVAIANGTGADIASVTARRVGTTGWKSIGFAAPAGKAGNASIDESDCAFDLQVTLADGKTVTYSGVNLCDVKLVTLRRNAAGVAWVDYD